MTRLEAIRHIRNGGRLVRIFYPEWDGVNGELEVWLEYRAVCSGFSRQHEHQHVTIGPIHVRFWETAWPHWIHATPKQLLGFIKRNYPRK